MIRRVKTKEDVMMNAGPILMPRRDFMLGAASAAALLPAGCRMLSKSNIGISGPFTTLRDGSWLYGHDSGDHDGLGNNPMNFYNVPMSPPLSIAEAARMFGIVNVSVCRWGRADDEYISQFKDLKRVSWAITGSRRERYPILLEHNFALLDKMPNLVAFDLDDYFRNPASGPDEQVMVDGHERTSARAVLPFFELKRLAGRMHTRKDRNLALQAVVYDYMLREEMRPVLDSVDAVQYWTWCGKDLSDLSKRFRAYRALAPNKPTFLGIYMWDYGNRRRLELDFMKHQLKVGFDLWRRGEVEGFVFHCSNLLNKGLPPVEYARAWFAEHADAERPAAVFREVPEPSETVRTPSAVVVPDLSVPAERARAIRAELDASGARGLPLLVGGDEWMPFFGETGRQILACGTDRILIVEPSGRVAWKHERCDGLVCTRVKDREVYWSDGCLRRVGFSMPASDAPAETLYVGPTGAEDVCGFDFTKDGTIVAAAEKSRMIVELNPETFVPLVWIKTDKEPRMVHKTNRGTYVVVFSDSAVEYRESGERIAEWSCSGKALGDAIRLGDGTTILAASDEVRATKADGGVAWKISASGIPGAEGGAFSSLQHLATGEVVVGVRHAGASIGAPRLAAFAVDRSCKVAWRVESAHDAGMFAVQKIEWKEEYD